MSRGKSRRVALDESGTASTGTGPTGIASTDTVTMRTATADDAAAIWRLVKATGVLDLNSPYAYLLLAKRFGDTCVVAELDDELVGFVAALRPADDPSVIFVWQIGVAAAARGRGLARRLLEHLLTLPACRDVKWLESTVTPGNAPSRALFRSAARALGADCRVEPYFDAEQFPHEASADGHEPEDLFRIGPLDPAAISLS